MNTIPKTNIDPDNGWKSVFLYQPVVFRVYVSLPGCNPRNLDCMDLFRKCGGDESRVYFKSLNHIHTATVPDLTDYRRCAKNDRNVQGFPMKDVALT